LLGRVVVLSFVVALSVLLSAYLLNAPQAEAAYPCSGKHVYPSQNLASVAGNAAAGTTFCVHDGTYKISSPVRVDNKDQFIGIYNDSTRPEVVTSTAEQVFNAGGSSGAKIQGLKISGAVGGNYCEPGCGQGIRGGANLTVYDAWITNNKNNGIGGTGPGLLVQNSVIERNGTYSFSYLDGGSSSAAGIKTMESMTVLNSKIRDNYWNGVWCDGGCGAFTVKNSILTGNGKAGIHDEISNGPAVFSGNTIKGNGVLASANRHAGLLIVQSANVDAYNNTFGGNHGHGIEMVKGTRHPLDNVRIHDNIMNGDSIKGCTLSNVSCWGN
jgi:hypothetical protein